MSSQGNCPEIKYHESSKTFHLTNGKISYIMKVLENGHVGQLYYGKAVEDAENFDHFFELFYKAMQANIFENNPYFSLAIIKQEYPCVGKGDFRMPAYIVRQPNGSTVTDLVYQSYTVTKGKPKLKGLPATYCENDNEASTLTLHLHDKLIGLDVNLNYTIFAQYEAMARSVEFVNNGTLELHLTRALSLSLDLPDSEYEFIHFDGVWARERHINSTKLAPGIQSVGSIKGHSSHDHNPFIMLRRHDASEVHGEVIGFSLVYSGNFLAQVNLNGEIRQGQFLSTIGKQHISISMKINLLPLQKLPKMMVSNCSFLMMAGLELVPMILLV